MDLGKGNPVAAPLWARMPQLEGERVALNSLKIDLMTPLPQNTSYHNYTGSLTTPPCSEGVNRMVMRKRSTASQARLAAFTRRFPHSTRPVRPRNGRTINGNQAPVAGCR